MSTIEQVEVKDELKITKIKALTPGLSEIAIEELTNIKPIKQKKALIVRVGGIGDSVILTVVAKQLHKKGYLVDFFTGSPNGDISQLFNGLDYLNEVKSVVRINGIDCVKDINEHNIPVEVLKSNYDEVYDYKLSIEHNKSGVNSSEGWRESLNSNYINWVDLSLAWANIDYTLLSDEEKIPDVKCKDVELYQKWYETTGLSLKNVEHNYRLIGIQLSASSLVRTFYKANELPELLHKQYPDDIIVIFEGNSWYALTKFGKRKIEFDEDLNPMVQSIEIVKNLDVFLSADSGFSHIASALRVKCVTVYTTVPSWTRAKYYINQINIDAQAPCRPCFTLGGTCPLREKQAFEALTDREKDLIQSNNAGINIFDMAKKYQTIPNALNDEFKSAVGKLKALSAKVPECVESISTDRILESIQEILK